MNFAFYIMGRDERYPLELLVRRKLKSAIDFNEEDFAGALYRLNGDFNGDGKEDVVLAADKDTLTIIMRDENEIFPARRSCFLSLPVSKKMIVEDINKDGFSDIIMFYPYNESQHGIIRLMLNWRKNFSK
jgi:hypothetical protein